MAVARLAEGPRSLADYEVDIVVLAGPEGWALGGFMGEGSPVFRGGSDVELGGQGPGP